MLAKDLHGVGKRVAALGDFLLSLLLRLGWLREGREGGERGRGGRRRVREEWGRVEQRTSVVQIYTVDREIFAVKKFRNYP